MHFVADRDAPQHRLNSLFLCGDCHSEHGASQEGVESAARVDAYLHSSHAKGVTEAGAIVRVNGVTARVDRRGRFSARVRLKEGANDLIVLSEGVGGKKREMKLDPVTVDTHAPGS